MISTNVGTAFCWTEATFGFKDFDGLFETDFGVDFIDFVDFVPGDFTGILAGDLAISRTGFETDLIGFWGGLMDFVGGDLVDFDDFDDFAGAVGVIALWGAIPVLAPWLCSSDWNLTELPSIFVRHFAVQL